MMFRSITKPAILQKNQITIVTFTVLLGLLLVLGACSLDSNTTANTIPPENAISGYDPVAYFTENKPVPGDEEFSYVWNHAKWLFSCKENMELFKSNPAKYAPQYNGYCAFALSRNDYADVNPAAWSIVNDKLYLTYNLDIKNAWLQDKKHYIAKADRNWKLRIEK